ncbi:MAG: sialidase family protein [Candidatus Dormibacteraceae bacterium]
MYSDVRRLVVGASVAAAFVVGASPALASTANPPVQLPDNPLAAASTTCAALVAQELAALPNDRNYPNSEVEPWIADAGGGKYIAAFQQDRWTGGGANGTTIAVFGGTSWKLAASQPKFSICEGATQGSPGYLQRSTDPWITVSKDGTAYTIADSFDATGPGFGGPSSILISRSTDSGNTWSDPVSVERDSGDGALNDKESITADQNNSSDAYAVWDRLQNPSLHAKFDAFNHTFSYRGPAMFSRTLDGGNSWSQGRVIFDPGQWNQTIGNQMVVQPDGSLVDLFDLINNEHGPFGHNASTTFQVAMITSHDHGTTWSDPTIIANITDTQVRTLDGQDIRTGDILPEIAGDHTNGNLYVAYQNNAKISFTESTNGGVTWSAPIIISRSGSAQAFTPSIVVSGNGTVGVSYYDLRHATATTPGLTDTWFDSCTAGCATASAWTESQLDNAGSFDMKAAPQAGGYFVGDYESIAPSGSGFRNLWVMAMPGTAADPTNVFSDTVS